MYNTDNFNSYFQFFFFFLFFLLNKSYGQLQGFYAFDELVLFKIQPRVCHRVKLPGAGERHSTRDKGHEEGGSAYAKAGSSLRSSPGYSRASTPQNQSLPTLLLCALTSDFTGGCPLPPCRSLCQRVNLQLQLIKFLGNQECLNPNPSDGSLTRLSSLPGHLQLCIRLFTVSQPREAWET